jgi:hypothetical protein
VLPKVVLTSMDSPLGPSTLWGGDEEIDQDVGASDQHRSDEGHQNAGLASARQVRVRAVRTDGPDDGGDDQSGHRGDEADGQQRADHVGQGADPGQARGIGEHISNDAGSTAPIAVMVVTMCVPSSELTRP